MSSKLFWAPPSFEWPTLLSTFLRNQLLWALFWVFFSFGQFLEPSLEQGENWGHSFEHSKECTYSQEPFFEWVYSRERSFEGFLKGSRSTGTLMRVKEHYWAKCFWQSLFLISAPFSQQFRKIRFVRFPIHIWELAWHVMRSRFVTRVEEWSENIRPFNFILNLWGEIETARGDFIFRVSLCHGMEL